MRESLKTALTVFVAGVTIVFQGVIGFTGLGERIGVERTIVITGAGVFGVAVVVVWVVAVEQTKQRRLIIGLAATALAIAITIVFLALTYRLHNILITQARHDNITTTTFRAAIRSADATISFYADTGAVILLRAIESYDREGVNAVRVEHTSETDFMLHSFQYPQMITFTHESARPLRLMLDTDNTVTFTTLPAVARHVRADLLRGGTLWIFVAALILWLSRSSRSAGRPKRRPGMRTAA